MSNKKETLEDLLDTSIQIVGSNSVLTIKKFIAVSTGHSERIYSEEDVKLIMAETWIRCLGNGENNFKELRDRILQNFKNEIDEN
jgi:hypothetical protein